MGRIAITTKAVQSFHSRELREAHLSTNTSEAFFSGAIFSGAFFTGDFFTGAFFNKRFD